MRPLCFFLCVIALMSCSGGGSDANATAATTPPKAKTSTAAAAGPVRNDERPLLTNTNTAGQPETGAPPQNSPNATQTAPVAVTGTHLARKP